MVSNSDQARMPPNATWSIQAIHVSVWNVVGAKLAQQHLFLNLHMHVFVSRDGKLRLAWTRDEHPALA